jgi:hypothetical protein
LALSFKQLRGAADYRNCVALSLNGGNYADLGCNHDGDLTKEFRFAAKPLPENNIVRLKCTITGTVKGTTEGEMILPKLKREKPERFTLKIDYEDAGDNDFKDFIVEIKAQRSIKLQIESCNTANCKLE